MTITLDRPDHFGGLEFTQTEPEAADGRYTRVAPCGCAGHFRRVDSGPLAGNTYGDATYETCDRHTTRCEGCGEPTYPTNHCGCGCGCEMAPARRPYGGEA